MKDIRSTVIKYAVTAFFGGIITAVTLMAHGFSEAASAVERYTILANGFTIPGVILLMIGVLMLISKDGFFDMVTFGLGRLGKALIPFSKKTDESFYDYKVRKSEQRLTGFSCVFVVGAVFLALGILFTVLAMTA